MLLAFSQCFTHTNAITPTGNPFFFPRASILVTRQIHNCGFVKIVSYPMLQSPVPANVTLRDDDVVILPFVYMRF